MSSPVLEVRELSKTYRVRRSLGRAEEVRAVDRVSFRVDRGRTLGIVGESGSGKSTIGRCVLGLQRATDGAILLQGRRVDGLSRAAFRPLRRHVQMVFQHPRRSFDPHHSVRSSVAESLQLRPDWSRNSRSQRVDDLLRAVNIGSELWQRRPDALSGGQLQRVAVARALAPEPELVFLDEPTSALDTSIRGEVLSLLQTLQARTGVAYLFVSHDLEVVRAMAHDVVVLHRGSVVEAGPTERVLAAPEHAYTRTLLAASGLATETL